MSFNLFERIRGWILTRTINDHTLLTFWPNSGLPESRLLGTRGLRPKIFVRQMDNLLAAEIETLNFILNTPLWIQLYLLNLFYRYIYIFFLWIYVMDSIVSSDICYYIDFLRFGFDICSRFSLKQFCGASVCLDLCGALTSNGF
jgi:hypothetical protein